MGKGSGKRQYSGEEDSFAFQSSKGQSVKETYAMLRSASHVPTESL